MVASFTRSAATELVSRDLPVPRNAVGTLHSLCYRALNSPQIAETHIDEFNEKHGKFALSSEVGSKMDEGIVEMQWNTEGDKLLNKLNLYRARMIDRKFWDKLVIAFETAWSEWKFLNDYIDFTDMISLTLETGSPPPGNPQVGFYDEVQDFNRMELTLVRHWAQFQDVVLLGGDDDQCSVAGTMVLLSPDGWVPIEQLPDEDDGIVTWYKDHSVVVGRKRSYHYTKGQRYYKGTVIRVCADGKNTATTLEHKWPFKWAPEARNKEVVYLMQQGEKFRIGRATLIRSDGCFNFGVRCRMEKADKGWILKVCSNRKEASLWESILAARYGIPQVLFSEPNMWFTKLRTFLDQEQINKFLNQLSIELTDRAAKCLADHDLLMAYPFWKRNGFSKYGNRIIYTQAANLLSDVMMIGSYKGGKKIEWYPCKIIKESYDGTVYSLDVEKHHHYFADGLLTHNCLYSFTGASPDAFLNPDIPAEQKRILSQSYRVPRKVQEFANRWIAQVKQREPKEYKPRDEEGKITRFGGLGSRYISYRRPEKIIEEALKRIQNGQSVMILTSCGYMLNPLKVLLKKDGVPFHNPYRKTRGDWNPLGSFSKNKKIVPIRDRFLAFLDDSYVIDDHPVWTLENFVLWMEVIKADGIFVRGAKKYVNDVVEQLGFNFPCHPVEFYRKVFQPEAFREAKVHSPKWFLKNIMSSKASVIEYVVDVYRKQGIQSLIEEPKLVLGTIHSVKGGESDVVILCPDLSLAGMKEFEHSEDRDAIIRTFYVGMTRARKELIICPPASTLAVHL